MLGHGESVWTETIEKGQETKFTKIEGWKLKWSGLEKVLAYLNLNIEPQGADILTDWIWTCQTMGCVI